MYAVIKTGGKQYRVAADQKIQIEKLEGQAGDQVEFTNVLMVTNGGSIDIGAPYVAGATVVGEIASQDRLADPASEKGRVAAGRTELSAVHRASDCPLRQTIRAATKNAGRGRA